MATVVLSRSTPDWGYLRRLITFALAWIGALVSVAVAVQDRPGLGDAHVYWAGWHGPLYAGGFVYPPVGALLFAPAAVLSWPVFAALWVAALSVAGLWLLWPVPVRLRIPFGLALAAAISWGNAATLLAVPLALAPRWPAAWAALAWTKVTPAVGMVALAQQRRWRDLAVALGVCSALGIGVLVVAPSLVAAWATQLQTHSEVPSYYLAILPWRPSLPVRVVLAAVIAWKGASRPWTLVVAAALATPDLSFATYGILAAAPRLMDSTRS